MRALGPGSREGDLGERYNASCPYGSDLIERMSTGVSSNSVLAQEDCHHGKRPWSACKTGGPAGIRAETWCRARDLGRSFIRAYYRLHTGCRLNLGNPVTFNEKLQWLKLRYRPPELVRLVDKYQVRSYVAERVGSEILIPTVGVFDSVDDIDIGKLPDAFVLKPTHGSGWVIPCKDKNSLQWADVRARLNTWMRRNYYYHAREWAYRYVRPRILCEHLLSDERGEVPADYKIFCFGGEPKFIQVDLGRFSDHRRNYYDPSWTPIGVEVLYPRSETEVPRPAALDEMLRLASKLEEPFPFCRVDLYSVGSRIYFGELTFIPDNGVAPIRPQEFDREWGELITLPSGTAGSAVPVL